MHKFRIESRKIVAAVGCAVKRLHGAYLKGERHPVATRSQLADARNVRKPEDKYRFVHIATNGAETHTGYALELRQTVRGDFVIMRLARLLKKDKRRSPYIAVPVENVVDELPDPFPSPPWRQRDGTAIE